MFLRLQQLAQLAANHQPSVHPQWNQAATTLEPSSDIFSYKIVTVEISQQAWAQSASGQDPPGMPGVNQMVESKHKVMAVVLADIAANAAVRLTLRPVTLQVTKGRDVSWGEAKEWLQASAASPRVASASDASRLSK